MLYGLVKSILKLDELFQVFKYWLVGRIINEELVMRINLIPLKREFAWIEKIKHQHKPPSLNTNLGQALLE